MTDAPLTVAAAEIPIAQHVTVQFLGMTFNADTIWTTLIAMAVVLVLAFWFRAKVTSGVPGKVQLMWEALVDWVRGQTKEQLGEMNPIVMPLAATLFIFLLIANWLEIIPSGEHPKILPSPTADVNL
ncbi:MAG: F0F1 ATP synthase subunit A, partial [Streptosporangiales bacterium]